jgi:hypothetical protein
MGGTIERMCGRYMIWRQEIVVVEDEEAGRRVAEIDTISWASWSGGRRKLRVSIAYSRL